MIRDFTNDDDWNYLADALRIWHGQNEYGECAELTGSQFEIVFEHGKQVVRISAEKFAKMLAERS